LGTAGHIDHGKTSLVKALTGTNTDRLPEEQRRGMTIELGFAEMAIGDARFGVVDVPGHERFVRTMVAGATGIDLALLVVAADDSVMPQTVEHVEILRLLGIDRGVVAITKCDVVDASMVELVQEEIRELLRAVAGGTCGDMQSGGCEKGFSHQRDGEPSPRPSPKGRGGEDGARKDSRTSRDSAASPRHRVAASVEAAHWGLANAEIVPVSSITGAGVDELKQAILRAAAHVVRPSAANPFRIAIDRVFTVQGRGTVVTGSVLRGCVHPADTLEILPAKLTCRVRDMQTHGTAEQELGRGQRAALNLSGIDREKIERGCELATPGYLEPSHIIDVRLDYLRTCERPLKSTQSARLELGTSEAPVRVVLHGVDRFAQGESAYAQLRSGEPIVSAHGQRFILRDETAVRTLGGGRVLRPVARRRRVDAAEAIASLARLESDDPAVRVEEVLRASGFHPPRELQICLRAGVELSEVGTVLARLEQENRWQRVAGTDFRATPGAVDDLSRRLVSWLERYHRAHPELPGRPADSVLGWLERVTGHKSLARPFLEDLIRRKCVSRLGKFIAAPAFAPSLSAADEKLLADMIEEICAGEFQPPALAELRSAGTADKKRLARLATLAVAMGELVAVDATIYLHSASEAKLRVVVGELISREGGVTVSQMRETLSTSRKYAVPFAEYLDRVKFTKRVGDQRVLVAPLPVTSNRDPAAAEPRS
jgi:selenocysteine-specific elongation factor